MNTDREYGSGNFARRVLRGVGVLLFVRSFAGNRKQSAGEECEQRCTSKVDPKQFAESMKSETDSYLESVMQAVNSAPDGEWIAANEEQVWNSSPEFRQRVFEQAVQQRIDAAGAAFSPSDRHNC